MSTSLSQQLQKLKVPQTSTLVDAKRKASILFDPKEAATKERHVIYDLGISGLNELIILNPSFYQFESTLFDKTSLSLERAVEQAEVNKLLDIQITKFLQNLSPYLLLRPAHLCIEWLLRRFQIHQYNQEALMSLIFPYHETNIFIKILQTMSFSQTKRQWGWLRPLQRTGVSVPKSAIIARAASDSDFMSFVCNSTMNSIKELYPRGHLLQVQINFYGSVIIGVLETAPNIKEWHISTVLTSLLKGLSSEVIDYASACYMITAQLLSRTPLTTKFCNGLITRICKVSFERLRVSAVLVLICIFDYQKEANAQFSDEALFTLIQNKWLTTILSQLANDVAVHPLCEHLVRGCVKGLQRQHSEAIVFKTFLERLLNDVSFSTVGAKLIISTFLKAFVPPKQKENTFQTPLSNGDIIDLNSEDDMPKADNDFLSWYSDVLRTLENQYPIAFDLTIKEEISSESKEFSHLSDAIKIALNFRLKFGSKNVTNIYENLYHHTTQMRLLAIQTLMKNLNNIKSRPRNYTLLKECLADRIEDDSELVVKEILNLPTEDFVDIIGADKFIEALIGILHKAHKNPNNWEPLTEQVIKHLTSSEIIENYDSNIILLSLMTLLFPVNKENFKQRNIALILTSPLIYKVTFLRELSLKIDLNDKNLCDSNFKRVFLDTIALAKDIPTEIELINSVESHDLKIFKEAHQYSQFLILLTACIKKEFSCEESLQLFKQVHKHINRFEIKSVNNLQSSHKKQTISLELFSDFISTLIEHTVFPKVINWEKFFANEGFFLKVFQILITQSFSQKSSKDKQMWTTILKETLDKVFKEEQDKIDFLLNFFMYEELSYVSAYSEMRIRTFKIFNSLIKHESDKVEISIEHILKMCVALSSKSKIIRIEALNSLKEVLHTNRLSAPLQNFVNSIVFRSHEISVDHEQFSLVLYTILKSSSKKSKITVGQKILDEIVAVVISENSLEKATFTVEILKLLKHINDSTTFLHLVRVGVRALDETSILNNLKVLNKPYNEIYQLIVERFDYNIIENVLMDNAEGWDFFDKIFNSSDVFVTSNSKSQTVPTIFLQSLDERSFEKMPNAYKLKLISLIIKTLSIAENDDMFISANKLLKKCKWNVAPFVTILENMYRMSMTVGSCRKKSNMNNCDLNMHLLFESSAWKEGVVLLELLDNKKYVTGTEKMVPALFELLRLCLEVEEQIKMEYTKQLTLSALLHCCQKAKADGIDLQKELPTSTFRIDQIVQCVRLSQNPQTHHVALILLTYSAALFPQQVLHNMVDIFTFMGSSIIRQDDAFSFHIISQIIESIIPIVVRKENMLEPANALVIPVQKVFSDILLDVPEHRRLPLYIKLLETLGVEKYLWSFLCVVFDAHVINDEKQRGLNRKSNLDARAAAEKAPKRLQIAAELTNSFPPQIVLETCFQLMDYVNNLPVKKENNHKSTLIPIDRSEIMLFDVNIRTAKQLRHYKYIIMQFLSTITSSDIFMRKIALLNETESLEMKPYYQNFIIKILSYAPVISTAIEKAADALETKYWKVNLHYLHEILDNAISLLSSEMFLNVITGLLSHKLLNIRKKVIDLLTIKLQQKDGYEALDQSRFLSLFKPLISIVNSILVKDEFPSDGSGVRNSPNELIYLQQTALIALKVLSKLYALEHMKNFKGLLLTLTKITKQHENISKIVFASVILTMIEVSSNLKAHSLAYLPEYMPQLINVLEQQAELSEKQSPDSVCIALISGLQKLFEALPLFLSPYAEDIIRLVCTISVRIKSNSIGMDSHGITVQNKLNTILMKIANEVPLRMLVPTCKHTYIKLLETKSFLEIEVMINMLVEALKNNNISELSTVQTDLRDFFLNALELRLHINNENNLKQATATESTIINAFVTYSMKLSENSFCPLYHMVYEWAFEQTKQKEAILTYFLLSHKIADSLKSLYTIFAKDFIRDAANVLNESNSLKTTIDPKNEYLSIELLKSVLNTLNCVLIHDNRKFMSPNRFSIIMQPIVDQVENRLVLENEDLQELLRNCMGAIAVSVANDVQWKQMNYQILMKTRTSLPEVRLLSFSCCVKVASTLGEDFSPLLPETVPFIAELLEDENPRVEKNIRKLVQELESILGESLQKYL